MNIIFKSYKLFFIFLLLFLSQLMGQNNELDVDVEQNKLIKELKEKISALEKSQQEKERQNRRKFADLDQRIVVLESQLKGIQNVNTPKTKQISTNSKWKDRSNWRRLTKGMSANQVKSILGEPYTINVGAYWTTWRYNKETFLSATVQMNGSLQVWVEPEF